MIFLKVYLHLRKSRHLGDADDPDLLATHEAILRDLADRDGIDLAQARRIREVESGEFLSSRPDFLAALQEWEALPEGAGGILYTLAIDRISRGDPAERARIRMALTRAGIRLRTVTEWIDLSDPGQALLFGLRSELAENELRQYKWRVALTRALQVRRGQVRNGAHPWGYQWDKNTKELLAHPERFPILQQVCREALDVSIYALARRYGIPEATLLQTLNNPTICGWPAQRHRARAGKERGSGDRLPRSEWRWPQQEGTYPAACTRAQWEAIQEALVKRTLRGLKTHTVGGWCRSVVQFEGATGRVRLGALTPHGKGSVPTYDLIRPDGLRLSMPREIVHREALAYLQSLFARPDLLATALARRLAAPPPPAPDLTGLRQQLDSERQRLVGLKTEAFGNGQDEEEALANRAAQQQSLARVKALKAELERALRPVAVPVVPLALAGLDLTTVGPGFEPLWEQMSEAERTRLVGDCVAALVVRVDRSSQPFRREFVRLVPADWLAAFAE